MWPIRGKTLTSFMIFAVSVAGAFCLADLARAGGLSCSVGEVVINNLKIGQTYSLTTLANLPLAVTNTGDRAVTVSVAPLIPKQGDLRQGALPVTSLLWAKAAPDSFDLEPSETKLVEILLTIPDDETLFGGKYQVNLWSHTVPRPGEMLGYGLLSRVIFTIDGVREAAGVIPVGNLGITMAPNEIVMKDLERGPAYSVTEFLTHPLSISNTSNQTLSIELEVLSSDNGVSSPAAGYSDLRAAATVELFPSKFMLEPGEVMPISATVTFPDATNTDGPDYMCVISAAVVGQAVQTQTFSRIFAHLR